MKILVTGGTGFVGGQFLKAGFRAEHEVVALCRSVKKAEAAAVEGVHWLEGSLGDVEDAFLKDVEVVVHFAAAGVQPENLNDWDLCLGTNLTDSMALFRKAVSCGVRRLIVCGSHSEYGKSGEQYDYIPATAPLLPVDAYGTSKAMAGVGAVGLGHQTGLEVAVLRLFHTYGEGEASYRFWPGLAAAARAGSDFPMTPGEQVRDFSAVDGVAEVFWRFATTEPLEGGRPVVLNVGTGRPERLIDFARRHWEELGARGRLLAGEWPYRGGEIMRYVPEMDERGRVRG